MDGWLSLLLGIGLSAACGFRVFVPLLVMSLASQNGHLVLAPNFEWIATPEAGSIFAIATVCEIFAYYIPWWDNLMDSLSSPAAVTAGTIATASVLTEASPLLQWTLAVIAGGGAAGAIQSGTVLVRGTSSCTTAGLANPAVSSMELGAAVVTSILSLLTPIVTVVAIVVLAIVIIKTRSLLRRRSGRIVPERWLPR